jgi:hypothetical protein
VVVAYGIIAPSENQHRSHRGLARGLPGLVPSDVRKLMFFNEIDEGLWFYVKEIELVPVPGTHPQYNAACDLAESYRTERLPFETISEVEAKRLARDKSHLIEWLDRNASSDRYLVIRSQLYNRFADDLAGRVTPVFRERGLKRNELTLLRASGDRLARGLTATVARVRR